MIGMVDLAEYMNRDLEGGFWVPGSESSKFHGHLNFNGSGVNIKTLETLEHLHKELEGLRFSSVLHSEIEGLGKVTFFDIFFNSLPGHSLAGREQRYEKWEANSADFLVGGHFVDKDAIKFNSVYFHIGGLYEWTGRASGFQSPDATTYIPQPLQEFELGTMDKLLGVWVQLTKILTQGHRNELKMVEDTVLTLSKKNKVSLSGELEGLIGDIYSLNDLFALLIGQKVGIEGIMLYDSDRRLRYQYFIRGAISKKDRKVWRSFVRLPDMKDGEFEQILKGWVKFKKENDYILGEFLNTRWRIGGVAKFLSYSRFIEAFHRNMYVDKPFDDRLIKSINKEIRVVTSKYEDRIQKRYSEQMIQVNNYTLEERLEFLLDKFLSNDVRNSLGVTLDFAARVKKLRNELTHIGKGVNKWDSQLYDVSSALEVVAHLLIFKSIGFTDELLLGRLRGGWRSFFVYR